MKRHPVVEIVKERGEVSRQELKDLMKEYGFNARGIGGLNTANKIEYIPETDSWRPGAAAYEAMK